MNILLSSVGRRTYLVEYFKEALHGEGLVHASNSLLTYTLKQADKYIITPNIYDDSYIDFLLNYCKKEDIKVIIPLFDIDLPILAKNKNVFKQYGIEVVVSEYEVIQICNDKWKTYCILSEYGLNQAKSYISIEDVKKELNNNNLSFPLILKPRWGMGSIGVYEVNTIDELTTFYGKIKNDIANTYLKYESAEDMDKCIIIQEKIYGDEYGLDVFNDLDGEYVTTVAKKKIAMRSGETDIAQIVDDKPFEAIGRVLSNNLKHIGNLDVDCFVTDKGDIYVLELNCRFGGQYPFSHVAGVNFPKQIIQFLNGFGVDEILITPTVGVTCCKDIKPVIV